MDDILVKSTWAKNLVDDLEETFATLRMYDLKINHGKYIFGVKSGHFLNYIVTEREIETNSEKVWALQEMKAP